MEQDNIQKESDMPDDEPEQPQVKHKFILKDFLKDNKNYFIMGAMIFFAFAIVLLLTDPIGVIPPSVDHACCDSFCKQATGYMECSSYTQQTLICMLPHNMTDLLPEIKGATPIQIFEVYNISAVCPTNATVINTTG